MAKSHARERVLRAAEPLFVEKGYEAVTVKDIAKAAGIHHASLYHHIPDGKPALYVEVMTRNMHRHQKGIQEAIAQAEDVRGQLRRIADWLLSQPAVDIVRMTQSDFPALESPVRTRELENLAYEATIIPIHDVLAQAQSRGELHHKQLGNIAGAIFASLQGLHAIPDVYLTEHRNAMAYELIDVFLRGLGAIS
jgi:AcrR family transcriptional regulator